MPLVAVYGTLRKGNGNHAWAINKEPLSIERIHGWKMDSLHGGFPGCYPTGHKEDSIIVEVYDITDKELIAIDRLEGYNGHNATSWFGRDEIETTQGPAYIYIWQGRKIKTIEHGDWNKYKREQYEIYTH